MQKCALSFFYLLINKGFREIKCQSRDKLKKARKRGELSNHGKRLRYMTTLLGNITFYKRLYQERGGKYRYLLDEKLGLTKNQRVSQAYQKIAGLLALVSGSYRKAEELIREFYGDSLKL